MTKDEINAFIAQARTVKKERGFSTNSAAIAQTRYTDSARKAVSNCLQALAKLNGVGVSDETWSQVSEILAPLQVANYREALTGVTINVRKGGGGRPRKNPVAVTA